MRFPPFLKRLRRRTIGLPIVEHDALLDKLHELDRQEDRIFADLAGSPGVNAILDIRDRVAEVMDELGWKAEAADLREDTAMRRRWVKQ